MGIDTGAFRSNMEEKIDAYYEAMAAAGLSDAKYTTIRNVLRSSFARGMELTDNSILYFAMDQPYGKYSPSELYRIYRRFKTWADTGVIDLVSAGKKTPYTRPSRCERGCIWARKTGCACMLDTPLNPLPKMPSHIAECRYQTREREPEPPKVTRKPKVPTDDIYGHRIIYKDSHSAMWR